MKEQFTYIVLIFIFLSIFVLIPLIHYINNNKVIKLSKAKIASLDGLRGYLSIGVFIHHFIITYYWHRTGFWVSPPQNFVNNLGQASVIMFFMITGYLFFDKIFNKTFNIKTFYIKRFYRIMPLYYFTILIMLLIIFSQEKFVLHENIYLLIKQILKWLFFIQSDINDYNNITHMNITKITAGVTWTLIYECLFYLILPILFFFRKYEKLLFIIIIISIYYIINPININLYYFNLNSKFMALFFMGFIFVKIKNNQYLYIDFDQKLYSIIVIGLILFELLYFNNSYGIIQYVILCIVFSLILLGNSIFGILELNFSRILGTISFSIYLLHGIILFGIYKLLLNEDLEIYHMPVVLCVVIFFSLFTYKFIEKPMMMLVHKYNWDTK